MCSTPFGITEVGIRGRGCSRSRAFSAQRLSASQRWAYECRDDPDMFNECSTPFGITEVGMARIEALEAEAKSAQRLSASQRWA